MGIFNLDNAVFRGLTKLWDCIYLSMLFVLTCLPIITIGAAMTALYYTVQKALRNERGYVGKAYWKAFRENFKQVTPIWLLMLAFAIICIVDIWLLRGMAAAGNPIGSLSFFFLFLLVFLFSWSQVLFPYMARFENTRMASIKNAALLAIAYLPRTFLLFLNGALWLMLVYFLPMPIIFIAPVISTWVQSSILERIFRKHMTEEDRKFEDELNQEYRNWNDSK